MKRILTVVLALVVGVWIFVLGPRTKAQNATMGVAASSGTATPVTVSTVSGTALPVTVFSPYVLTPISSTAAVGSAATLTIPTPSAGLFNYVCYLAIEGSNNGTVLGAPNLVTTSTNFNAFAAKFSITGLIGALESDTGVLVLLNSSAPGCAKSTSSAVSTTFTSPTNTNEAFAWYALYFQAP